MLVGVDSNLLLHTEPSGVEVYLDELVRWMPAIAPQHSFRLYFNYLRPRYDSRVASFAGRGVEIRTCRMPTRATDLLHRYARLPIDWLAGRTDLMFYPSFLVRPQLHGRAVVTVHDMIPMTHPEFCAPHDVRRFTTAVRENLRRADAVIVVSNYSADTVIDVLGVDRARIYVVPNGINEQFLLFAGGHDSAATARKYGLEGPYILFVGSREPRKNLPRLVRAFGALKPELRRRYRLVLAGKQSWDEPAILRAIAELPPGCEVVQLGHVAAEDLPGLYGGASAFCFPSLVEGFGIPPLEAMASGCPVLAADIPALREMLGDAALWTNPRSIEELRDNLHRLLEDSTLAQDLRDRGLRLAAQYSWERCARETISVFDRVAGTA